MKLALFFSIVLFVSPLFFLHGQQLHLTSSSNWVNLGDLDVMGDQISFEAFIYMEAEPLSVNKFNILSKHENASNCNYFFRHTNFGITTYNSGNSGTTTFYNLFSNFNYNLFRWYHVAATYDGQKMKFYVNGCLVNEMNANGNLFQNNFPTGLGQRWIIEDEQFIGYIDEVKIWSRAITVTEIQEQLNGIVNPMNTVDLIAYYTFSDGFTNVANPGTFDGVAINNPVISTDNPRVFPDLNTISIQTAAVDCVKDSGSINLTDGGLLAYTLNDTSFSANGNWNNLSSGTYIIEASGVDWCIDTSFTVSISTSSSVETFIEAHLCPSDTAYFNQEAIISPGNYQAVFSFGEGCDSIVNLEVTVSNNDFFAETYNLCKGIIFEIEGPVNSTNWSTGEIDDRIQIQDPGTYTATWVDEQNCQLQDSFTVILQEGANNATAYAPNIFSPNSDGRNDTFGLLLAEGNLPDVFLLRIFNRWGSLIFETSDPLEWWDGKHNGAPVEPGTYVWMSRYSSQNCAGVDVQNRSGSISLIR